MPNPDPSLAKGPCPSCGQRLSLPTVDLQQSFQCPRCQRPLRASDLVAKHLTVNAVPLPSPFPPHVHGGSPSFHASPSSPGGAHTGQAGGITHGVPAPAVSSFTATPPFSQTPTPSPSAPAHVLAAPGALAPASPGGPGLWTSAFELGHQGVEFAGDAGGKVAQWCSRVDARLHSGRAVLVFVVALPTGIAPFLDAYLFSMPGGIHLLTWLLSGALALLVAILFVARLGSLRDEDGAWNVGLLTERMSAWLSSLVEGISAWLELDAGRKLLVCLRGAMSLSIFALSVCSAAVVALDILALLSLHVGLIVENGAQYEQVLSVVQGLVFFGLVLSGIGTFLWQRKLAQPAARPGRSVTLPSVLDCNDQRAMQSLAAQTGDPALGALLTALADWKPRHHDKERGYQLSLLRFLKGRLPELGPDEEVPLPSPTGRHSLRADITVGPVLIEMKRDLSTSAMQRAVGQLGMYLAAWKQGPLLLLVCDPDPSLSQGWLRQEVERLRLQGPVSLVLARTGRR